MEVVTCFNACIIYNGSANFRLFKWPNSTENVIEASPLEVKSALAILLIIMFGKGIVYDCWFSLCRKIMWHN
jgi:hypothetical protein